MTDKTNNATATASVSFPFATILVVLLAVAKTQNLWDLGDLSWWWVFAPYWLGLALLLVFLLIFAVIGGVLLGGAALLDANSARKSRKAREERKRSTLPRP